MSREPQAQRVPSRQRRPPFLQRSRFDRTLLLGPHPPGLEIAPAQVELEGIGIDLDF